MSRLALLSLSIGLLGGWASASADEPAPTRDGIAFFEQKIRPVLVERCIDCHSGGPTGKIKGGLRLDSRDAIRKGGDGGPILTPGDPDASRLIQALRHDDDELKMPPKGPLSDREIADFVTWVKLGAPDPREAVAEAPGQASASDGDKAKEFWSFLPVSDPAVPEVHDQTWARNDVDRFLLAKLEAKRLSPAPSASKRALIRRASFDLTGLPPTPEEVEAFLADESPNAFESVVDRLLASPQYGERWGRHWLDLVRYADTSGCNSDYPVPSAHKYRDYVIDAFNRDTPFDRFVQEQVAGDLLPHQSEAERWQQIVATGYLAIARRFGSHNNEFHLTYEDMIDNLGKTFLGLSISCARCHDHKFDPIPQRDYYAIYGILQSSKYAFPGTEVYQSPTDFVALGTPKQAEKLRAHETELDALSRQVLKLGTEKKALLALEKAKKPAVLKGRTLLEVRAELGDALDRIKELEDEPPAVEKAFAASEGIPADAKLQRKGDPKNEGDPVPRGFLQILGGHKLPEGSPGSGRLELAAWLTAKDNPLTARVMVNRIWQHHFGRGLVATPNDFGTRGKLPTHPELLDWLASRFVEEGWSIKAMHRRLMLSQSYQMASVDDPARSAVDPNNDLLWSFRRRRLSAEEIRDAMLAVAGTLDRTPGGPHPFPPESTFHYTQHKPFVAVYETDRRSVYLIQQRLKKHPFFEVFDGSDPNATTADRPITTTPLQALFLLNDRLAHEQADKFAVRVGLAFADEEARIDYAFRLAFGRPATADEIKLGRDYLLASREQMKEAGLPADRQPRAALASFARVLLSSNEFLYVD
ncbi:PSD1 and planctomycete cytochrome C domain-containing protein [Singulisphaera sp. Ch08]|uniref:PSD1 and planctomycete cytochrome C domain-containing protein n=1 Tax=Singulisphaera sp. Ch08 TaxID=3120278 RepID=A0AAU7C6V6_9BACT